MGTEHIGEVVEQFTNSIFMYNTASGQTYGGGVACIRNAFINIINSTFKHNFANHHAGVFYIHESHTTVDGSLFINNSAVLDGGVFYTYIHASDYIIRRSQFSENMAGDNGGVMLIGRPNCYVSIDKQFIIQHSYLAVTSTNHSTKLSHIFEDDCPVDFHQHGAGNYSDHSSSVPCTVEVKDGLITVDPLLPFWILFTNEIFVT